LTTREAAINGRLRFAVLDWATQQWRQRSEKDGMVVERLSLASLELRLQTCAEFVPVLRGQVRAWLEDPGASKTVTTRRRLQMH
jgi:hypothetical protein